MEQPLSRDAGVSRDAPPSHRCAGELKFYSTESNCEMDCPLELPAAELPMLELPIQLNPEAPAPFNCMTRELWSDEKTAWCCDNEKLGCPVAEAAPLAAPVKTPAPQGVGHKIKNFFNNLFG